MFLSARASTQQKTREAPPAGMAKVVRPSRSAGAFTRLACIDGVLTGDRAERPVHQKVNLATSGVQINRSTGISASTVRLKNRIIQLTWQRSGLVDRRPSSSSVVSVLGGGLTHDGTRLIMSDGSTAGTLKFFHPETFRQTGTLIVRDGGRPVAHLNELEYVKGQIYANVWQTERLAIIAPKTGRVTGWVDLHGLLDPREAGGVDVLNGIAYDAAGDRLFVTGKLWPRIFEIRLTPKRL